MHKEMIDYLKYLIVAMYSKQCGTEYGKALKERFLEKFDTVSLNERLAINLSWNNEAFYQFKQESNGYWFLSKHTGGMELIILDDDKKAALENIQLQLLEEVS